MKTVLIVDDEEDARKLLRFYIAQHKILSIVGEAKNGNEAVELINKLKPDTVFLDIQMPGLNGFEVLSHINIVPEVIFTTAYDEYAIKAFEIQAIDYLLKPYSKARFEKTLSRILNHQINNTSFNSRKINNELIYLDKIILHKGARQLMINVDDIIYGEAYGDYTKIYTEKDELLSSKGISHFVENVNLTKFVRIHRSHFVNLDCILEIKKNGRYTYAILKNKKQIKISESYLLEIKKRRF